MALTACGVSRKTATKVVPVPSQAEAEALISVPGASVFVDSTTAGPVIYALAPHKDSSLLDIITLAPEKGEWKRTSTATYPYEDECGLPLAEAVDSARIFTIAGQKCLTARYSRNDGKHFQKTAVAYSPADFSLISVTFNGTLRRDGKIYGNTNAAMSANQNSPRVAWGESVLKAENDFVFLSQEQIKSDQAIEWWLNKNAGLPSKLTFGQLPADCTLVQKYAKARKENGSGFQAALFDTEEYTVIVARNKSTGTYTLAWVEPKCRNSRTDALLNSIYFSSGSRLTLFYYKGSRTYKYSLSLSSGDFKK